MSSPAAQTFGFVLLPKFALMSYASATEPLRAANLLAGREIYNVLTLSADGGPVRSSAGIEFDCEFLDAQQQALHTVFVCAGGSPNDWVGSRLHSQLRILARQGVRIGGISGGSYILATAGLLEGHDFTIHWEHAAALREAFPHLKPRQARFVLDRTRVTCGGGVAPLDMMHILIAERHGEDFARSVSDWYLHTTIAESAAPQRSTLPERFGVHHPVLITILNKMESTIERPLSRSAMAMFAKVSSRHLDRLFETHLMKSFSKTYVKMRLYHARRLLRQSLLSISEIAYATGFSSPGHFSTSYRVEFGITPRQERRTRSPERDVGHPGAVE